MVHVATPGPDNGHFSTEEVRRAAKPAQSTSRIIGFPFGHYKRPPNIAAGFDGLNISCDGPIRANLIANDITKDTFRIAIESWGDSTLYSASTTWIEHKAGAKQCIFGQFDTSAKPFLLRVKANAKTIKKATKAESKPPRKCDKPITFAHTFDEPPEIVCWLNRLDLASGPDHDYKIRAFADEITGKGFTGHLNTWHDGEMHGAAMCWIAFPKRKKDVDSGRFSTNDVRRRTDPRARTSGKVRFKQRFEVVPTIVAALSMIDAAGNADLRVKLSISEVDRGGFRWTLETWDDSTLYAAAASWIALGFP